MGKTIQIDQELLNQVRSGEKLRALIAKSYGHSAISSTRYQVTVSNRVDFFIVAKTANLASQFKTFLGNNFGINHSNVSGVDVNLTLAISLSDLTQDSLSRLKLAYKNKVSNENIPEHKLQVIIEAIKFPKQKQDEDSSESNDEEIVERVKPTSPLAEKKTNIDRFRSSFEVFLSQISSFEATQKSRTSIRLNNLFSYVGSDEHWQVLNCKDGVIAFYLEKAALYFVNGYQNSTVIRDANIVRINCEPFLNQKKERKPLMGSFCLSPNENSDLDEVKNRLHKIACMTRPIVEQTDAGIFKVKYSMFDTTQKIYGLISLMGWPCVLEEDNSITITAGINKTNEESISVDEEIQNEEALESKEGDLSLKSGNYENSQDSKIDNETENPEIIVSVDEDSSSDEIPIQEVKIEVVEEVKPSVESIIIPDVSAVEPTQTSLVAVFRKINFPYSLYPFCRFSGSKEEGIEKLKKIYSSESFKSFSQVSQKRISDTLKNYYIEEYPERYAMSIVEHLSKD